MKALMFAQVAWLILVIVGLDSLSASATETDATRAPRVALYPLDDALYRQHHPDGSAMSALITSLLLVELGAGPELELLDRSIVPALLQEKTMLLVDSQSPENLRKLSLSAYSLVGSLLAGDEGTAYTLKLVENRSGEIVSAQRFPFEAGTLKTVVAESADFVRNAIRSLESGEAPAAVKPGTRKIAVGHFFDISAYDGGLTEGRGLSEALVDALVNEPKYRALARTQMLPLVFEQYLRKLQYKETEHVSSRDNADWVVHGVYRAEATDGQNQVTVYLYIDSVGEGRELRVLKAMGWDKARAVVKAALFEYFPRPPADISDEDRKTSRNLLFQAIEMQGMSVSAAVRSGDYPLGRSTHQKLARGPVPGKIAPAIRLIEQSLEQDPMNADAQLALASLLKAAHEGERSRRHFQQALASPNASSRHVAWAMRRLQQLDQARSYTADSFADIPGPGAEAIYQALVKYAFLEEGSNGLTFNHRQNMERVMNRPYAAPVGKLDLDTSIRALEILRAGYDRSGKRIEYEPPSKTNPNISEKRAWPQVRYPDSHNEEAQLHTTVASAVSGQNVLYATSLPSVTFYPETKKQSPARRHSRLAIAIDGFAASVFLAPEYLKPRVLLGHALCQPEIARCSLANQLLSWAVDHFSAADQSGPMSPDERDAEERYDRLMFIAADLVDRVEEAPLADLMQRKLRESNYLLRKQREKIKTLRSLNPSPQQKNRRARALVRAYANANRASCEQLKRTPRRLTDSRRLETGMARIVGNNPDLLALRARLLGRIESDYPEIYPHLLLHAVPGIPTILDEQDDMVARIAAGESRAIMPDELMEYAFTLFQSRAERSDEHGIASARRYITSFEDYYGLTENTAIDFAWMHQKVGEHAEARRILRDYGKSSFQFRRWKAVNGTYVQNGFDDKGRLTFECKDKPGIKLIYNASEYNKYAGLGEHSLKWRLRFPSGSSMRAHDAPDNPALFRFGTHGGTAGEIAWESSDAQSKNENKTESADGRELWPGGPGIEVAAISDTASSTLKTVQSLFAEGFVVGHGGDAAIKGEPRAMGVGPLRDAYFKGWFTRSRKLDVIKEILFQEGYLSVNDVPVEATYHELKERIERDFPDFEYAEVKVMIAALMKPRELHRAGRVTIYWREGDSWNQAASLAPNNARQDTRFGQAVAIDHDHALVCDGQGNNLYSYYRAESGWELRQKIDSNCTNIAMSDEWAVTAAREKVIVYRGNGQVWQRAETLQPDNYRARREKRHNFEYFGASLAIADHEMWIGNPVGGAQNTGEVYRFVLVDGHWKQAAIMSADGGFSFGKSLSRGGQWLAVGDPSYRTSDAPKWKKGAVYLYRKKNGTWLPQVRLMAKDPARGEKFGQRVLVDETANTVLIKSKNGFFRHELNPQAN